MHNVLIADDSKTMRMQVEQAVLAVLPGAALLFANDGAEVLKFWRTQAPPHLTVLDVHMPVLNGLEVLRHAAADGLTIPRVIIYTASRDDDLRQKCLDAGAAAVVTKSRETIRDAIRSMFPLDVVTDSDSGVVS